MSARTPFDRLVVNSRYLMIAGIIGLLVGAAEACCWSAVNVYHVVEALLRGEPYTSGVVGLLHMLDAFLVAAVLLIVAIGTYGLFISPLEDVPDALVVPSLHALKTKFSSVLVLLMTVTFVEHLMAWNDPWNTLVFGGAIAIVAVTLIGFNRWTQH
jgi:uncharacterized membrane protein YqhA